MLHIILIILECNQLIAVAKAKEASKPKSKSKQTAHSLSSVPGKQCCQMYSVCINTLCALIHYVHIFFHISVAASSEGNSGTDNEDTVPEVFSRLTAYRLSTNGKIFLYYHVVV